MSMRCVIKAFLLVLGFVYFILLIQLTKWDERQGSHNGKYGGSMSSFNSMSSKIRINRKLDSKMETETLKRSSKGNLEVAKDKSNLNAKKMLDVKRLKKKDYYDHRHGPPLLTLFTTWKPGMESSAVYNNTVNMWSKLQPRVKLVFFGNKSDISAHAKSIGWSVLPVTETKCNGTPVLSRMFKDVYKKYNTPFYGFANGDILFDNGLIDTLQATKGWSYYNQNKTVLLSGRRIDMYLDTIKNFDLLYKDVAAFSLSGAISYGYAADFFITTKYFPWDKIPDFVVGRPQYDNYLLYMSRQYFVYTIDATMSVVALHQRTKAREKNYDECNERILKESKRYRKKFIDRGHLDCVNFESKYLPDGSIGIIKRREFTKKC